MRNTENDKLSYDIMVKIINLAEAQKGILSTLPNAKFIKYSITNRIESFELYNEELFIIVFNREYI